MGLLNTSAGTYYRTVEYGHKICLLARSILGYRKCLNMICIYWIGKGGEHVLAHRL